MSVSSKSVIRLKNFLRKLPILILYNVVLASLTTRGPFNASLAGPSRAVSLNRLAPAGLLIQFCIRTRQSSFRQLVKSWFTARIFIHTPTGAGPYS